MSSPPPWLACRPSEGNGPARCAPFGGAWLRAAGQLQAPCGCACALGAPRAGIAKTPGVRAEGGLRPAPTPAPRALRSLTACELCGAEAQSQLDPQDRGQQPERGRRLLLLLLLQKSVSRARVHSMMHLSSTHRIRLTGACNQERTRRCLGRGAAGPPSSVPLPAGTPLLAPTGITSHPPPGARSPRQRHRAPRGWTAGEGRPGRGCAGTAAAKSAASPRLLLDPHFSPGLCVSLSGTSRRGSGSPRDPPPRSGSCPGVAGGPGAAAPPGPAGSRAYLRGSSGSFLPASAASPRRSDPHLCATSAAAAARARRKPRRRPRPPPARAPPSGSRGARARGVGTPARPRARHLSSRTRRRGRGRGRAAGGGALGHAARRRSWRAKGGAAAAPRPIGIPRACTCPPRCRAASHPCGGPGTRPPSVPAKAPRVPLEPAWQPKRLRLSLPPPPGQPGVCPSGSAGAPIRCPCLGVAGASPSVCAGCAGALSRGGTERGGGAVLAARDGWVPGKGRPPEGWAST